MGVRDLIVAIVVLTSASSAFGEAKASADSGREEAAEAFWAGHRQYEAGNFDEAAVSFGKAYTLTRDPEVLFDMAQAYRKAGKCELALQSYERFLVDGKASASFARAEKLTAELRETCKAQPAETPAPTTAPQPAAEAVPKTAPPTPAPPASFVSHESKSEKPRQPGASSNAALVGSLAVLASGLVVGGVAAGLELWNHNRGQRWQTEDTDLAKGVGSTETPLEWASRQGRNDELAHSITRVNNEALVLGLGSFALLTTSAILFYSSTNTAHEKAASRTDSRSVVAGIGPRSVVFTMSW